MPRRMHAAHAAFTGHSQEALWVNTRAASGLGSRPLALIQMGLMK